MKKHKLLKQFIYLVLIILNCTRFYDLQADEPIAVSIKIEKTNSGLEFKVICPENMANDKTLPVYYLFSYNFEGKPLEVELMRAVNHKKMVLVIIEGLQNVPGVGQLVHNFLEVNEYVHKNYSVHNERNYITGYMEGAIVGSAAAKWVEKEVKGLLLFDGIHTALQGQPLLKCSIYSLAKKDSAELRSLTALKKRLEDSNKDFTIMEYDKKSGLPDYVMIDNGIDFLQNKWIRKNNDTNPYYLNLRLEMAESEIKVIDQLLKNKKLEEAYDAIEGFKLDFSNSTDKKMSTLIDKVEKIKNNLLTDTNIVALVEFRKIISEKSSREINFSNLTDTSAKLESLQKKYPQTNSAKLAEDAIKQIKELIFNRKLNIESRPGKDVAAEYLKFTLDSQLPEASKNLIQNEYDKCQATGNFNDLIMNTLILYSQDYGAGMVAFGMDKLKSAEKHFEKIEAGNNNYLKSYQLYYLARISIINDNFERAEEILIDMMRDNLKFSTHQADAFFLLAVCYYNQFKREKALALLSEFGKRFSDAPERMLIGAYQLQNKIEGYDEGSLEEVEERMDFSRRKLKNDDLNKPAFDNQERVVAILDKLIKEAEQKEQNERDKNKNRQKQKGGSNRNPDSPAEESEAPEGESNIGNLKRLNRGNKEDEWGKDRDKEREKILNAMKEKFPERYRELIEQYYKGLQKTDE